MNAIGRKLRSRRGASITFALLLFLVCAMVSSVAIVAGTAAVGRVSNMAEADQRYYAVTSAVELLKSEMLNGKKVIVTLDKTSGDIETEYEGESLGLGEDTLSKAIAAQLIQAMQSGDITKNYTLGPSGAIENARLTCNIAETVKQNGLVSFLVSSEGDAGKDIYRLEVVFKSNTRRDVAGSTAEEEKTEVEWKLHSVKKVRGNAT